MADRYAAGLTQTGVSTVVGATATDACGELLGNTDGPRAKIYDLLFSHGAAPADTVIRWEVMRSTTSATGTSAAETPLDFDAPAAMVLVEEEITAGPTVTANSEMLDFDLNQRATFRWVAAPSGEIMVPAAVQTVFFNPSSGTYTGVARVTTHWEE